MPTTSYRIIGADEMPYGALMAPMVTVDGWAHSVWVDHAAGTQTAKVRRADTGAPHPTLDGLVTEVGSDEPRRLAYEAGVLAYHVREVEV